MATDQTPPRIKLILTVAVITPLTLFALKFVFDSYFITMSEAAAHEKLAEPVDLHALRAAEEKNLTTSGVPITAAMMEIGKGRNEQGGPDLITPQQSDDLGPMTGWSKLPRQFDLPPGAGGDGGMMMTGDGGMMMMSGDGGMMTSSMQNGANANADGGANAPRMNAPNDGGAPQPRANRDGGRGR